MNSGTKFVIVLIVLLLSIGPVSYFFERPKTIDVQQNDNGPKIIAIPGNLSAQLIEVDPYIGFAATSDVSNKTLVESMLASIPGITNLTVSVSLSPQEEGKYLYKITANVFTPEDLRRVGFQMMFKLNDFFTQQSPWSLAGKPFIRGKVRLIEQNKFEQAGGTINVTTTGQTMFVPVLLYINNQPNETIKISCNQVLLLKNNSVQRASDCIDATVPYRYGLTFSMWNSPIIHKARLNATVASIGSVFFIGTFDNRTMPNATELEQKIGVQVFLMSNGDFEASPGYVNETETSRIFRALTDNGLSVKTKYKKGSVVLPATVSAGGAVFDISSYGEATATLKYEARPSSVVDVELTLAEQYGEIVNVKADQA